ncbi:siderophore-interacting protein [Corynebacterium alimapuense]|uniref:NADPH-dependent ferric siderophore reductase n=1 Tax=Corynebacterium alimapuense TaxID=1576874 RepID=A0A3M8K673_9CORY|nr:siderophore-interacting protein [Corynebacterium alimapuense]RNE48369.1 NADPH-dependent ferric siderophore reductase [Corynebacterium alimapuense]
MTAPARKNRPIRKPIEATVTGTTRLSPDLIRLSLNAPGLVGKDLAFSDHYIKLIFVPEEADYAWPFDIVEIRENLPRELHPVTRTYTLRRVDTLTGDFEVDFVTHGDEGLAGPWSQRAEEGDTIAFLGPGGAWAPDSDYEHFVLAGDETAAPALAAAVEKLPEGASAEVYVEIANAKTKFSMPERENVNIHWVYRDGATPGTALSAEVRSAGIPQQRTSWFIHGVAEMIRELRRFLFVDGGVDKADVSISGYWRIGMTEDQWQSSKQEFIAAVEQSEAQELNQGH